MYRAETRQIRVSVMPVYIDERSAPAENRYFWAYQVTIENNGGNTVQLLSRYWHIVDANGAVEEVRGPGVVGEQPVLGPGDSYEYTSGCPLTTPSGFMSGTYTMTDELGERFDVAIPAFALDLPDAGTYWYHGHSGFQEQTGVYGAIVIEPRDTVQPMREHVLMLSDWTLSLSVGSGDGDGGGGSGEDGVTLVVACYDSSLKLWRLAGVVTR